MKKMMMTAGCSLLIGMAGLASAANAEMIAGLVGENMLAHVDTGMKAVVKTVTITGLPAPVLGIDRRPSDGMLYALAADGTVATIDPMTGAATVKTRLQTTLPAGVMATVDFNPAADRLRIIGSDGTNLRANVDDGKVTTDKPLNFKAGDANAGKTPMVTAGAYSNAVKGTKETALYNVDTTLGVLVKQAPPNDGVLSTIGSTGTTGAVALDIVTDGAGKNTAYLMVGDTLHTLDIASGKTMQVGKVAGASAPVRDIAVLPN